MLHLHVRAMTFAFAFLLLVSLAAGESGREAWLRYPALSEAAKNQYRDIPEQIAVAGDSPILTAARQELIRGLSGMLGRGFEVASQASENTINLGTAAALKASDAILRPPQTLGDDGFWLSAQRRRGAVRIVILGGSERGVLYGVFTLLSKVARGEDIAALNKVQNPSAKFRWVDQWDNLDGSIERGYAGRSIFFASKTAK